MTDKGWLKKYAFIFLAVNLLGLAIALILESQLGCDPIGLLCDGISQAFSINYGLASSLYNVAIIIIALLVARRHLGMGTIIYGVSSGIFIEFYRMLISPLELANMGIGYAIVAFIIGEICMAAAFALLMQLELGMTALDATLMKLKEVTKLSYSVLKLGMDILFVVVGTVLGGRFGIGTIVSAVVTGFLVTSISKMIRLLQEKRYVVEA